MRFAYKKSLTKSEIEAIEHAFSVKLSGDLLEYLKKYGWRKIVRGVSLKEDPSFIKEELDDSILSILEFDVVNNESYWPVVFGEKPSDPEKRVSVAKEYVRSLPSLVPIKGFKYLVPTKISPESSVVPVISFQQFVDTIIYYDSIADFMEDRPTTKRYYSDRPTVQGWIDVIDGLGAEDDAIYTS